MIGTYLSAGAMLLISAFDHRLGWSSVPLGINVIGNVLVAVGLLVAQFVIIQNSYAAAITEGHQP